jgi:hypothetical protein
MRNRVFGRKAGKNVSMAIAVPASSPYGVKPAIVLSFPGHVEPTGAVHVSDWLKGKLKATEQKRDTAYQVLDLD